MFFSAKKSRFPAELTRQKKRRGGDVARSAKRGSHAKFWFWAYEVWPGLFLLRQRIAATLSKLRRGTFFEERAPLRRANEVWQALPP